MLESARAVFAQHGYHGATIEAVARGSGTPRPTVYELFGSKDELFAAVVDDSAERVVARLSASFTESDGWELADFVRHNFAAVFELFEQDRDAVTVLLNAEQGAVDRPAAALGDVRRRVLHDVAEFTRSRWDALGVDIGEAGEIMAVMFFRMAEGLAMRQADEPGWSRDGVHRPAHRVHVGGHRAPVAAVAGRAGGRGPALGARRGRAVRPPAGRPVVDAVRRWRRAVAA